MKLTSVSYSSNDAAQQTSAAPSLGDEDKKRQRLFAQQMQGSMSVGSSESGKLSNGAPLTNTPGWRRKKKEKKTPLDGHYQAPASSWEGSASSQTTSRSSRNREPGFFEAVLGGSSASGKKTSTTSRRPTEHHSQTGYATSHPSPPSDLQSVDSRGSSRHSVQSSGSRPQNPGNAVLVKSTKTTKTVEKKEVYYAQGRALTPAQKRIPPDYRIEIRQPEPEHALQRRESQSGSRVSHGSGASSISGSSRGMTARPPPSYVPSRGSGTSVGPSHFGGNTPLDAHGTPMAYLYEQKVVVQVVEERQPSGCSCGTGRCPYCGS